MPAKLGGKKTRRGKKSTNNDNVSKSTLVANEHQLYAQVSKLLGDKRIIVRCSDGSERLAIIPGKFKKSNNGWVSMGMYLLVEVAEYEKEQKVYVINIYNQQDVRFLVRNHLIDSLCTDEPTEDIDFVKNTGSDGSDLDSDNSDEMKELDPRYVAPQRVPTMPPPSSEYDNLTLDDL